MYFSIWCIQAACWSLLKSVCLRFSQEKIKARCGMDAVHYLSFQHHLIFLLSIITITSCSIILPVNLTGNLLSRFDFTLWLQNHVTKAHNYNNNLCLLMDRIAYFLRYLLYRLWFRCVSKLRSCTVHTPIYIHLLVHLFQVMTQKILEEQLLGIFQRGNCCVGICNKMSGYISKSVL